MRCFLFIVLLCSYSFSMGGRPLVQPQHPLHTHLARPTPIECETTEDCRDHYSHRWCQSGTFCSRGRCHIIPSYPCKSEERCDEVNRKCIEKLCKNWKDCDDGLFCNGVERCVAGICKSEHRFDCTHGQCSEDTQVCATPLSLREEVERVKLVSTTTHNTRKSGGIYIMDEPTAAPTNSTGDTTIPMTMWIVAAVVFGSAVILFIVFSIRGGGPVSPLIIVNNGAGGENGEDPESNFQHQLHYQ